MKHWTDSLLGKKWSPCGHGPDDFSCYGLVHFVFKNRFNILLPEHGFVGQYHPLKVVEAASAQCVECFERDKWMWKECDRGCVSAVLMGDSNCFHHLGFTCPEFAGKILHVMSRVPVCLESERQLAARNITRLKFYRYNGDALRV